MYVCKLAAEDACCLRVISVPLNTGLGVCPGIDTTAIGLSWTIHHLASRPAIQTQIIAEVDAFGQQQPGIDDMAAFPFTDACFHEAMRLNPPVNPLIPQACNVLLPCLCSCYSIWPE